MIASNSLEAKQLKKAKKMTLATLFSGIDAPEFVAREVFDEVETIFACEIDKFARQSYLANHEAPLAFYEDVCDLDAKAYAGQIDILIGGSPCQDFSIAGQRARGFNKGNEFELCPTISSSSFEQNNLLKSERIRKLTPRECLCLQGFPKNFKIVVSDTQAYKQAGNAMSVNVVKMIFEQIKLAKNKDFRLGA